MLDTTNNKLHETNSALNVQYFDSVNKRVLDTTNNEVHETFSALNIQYFDSVNKRVLDPTKANRGTHSAPNLWYL